MKLITYSVAILSVVTLASCGAPKREDLNYSKAARQQQQTDTGVRIGDSEAGVPTNPSVEYVRVKMDRTIFLDPPEHANPSIYVRVRNTTGREWELNQLIAAQLSSRGYAIVNNTADADYVLQANLLLANEVSAAEIAKLDETEYGENLSSIVSSAALGAATGGLTGAIAGGGKETIIGAVAGGAIGAGLSALAGSDREKRLLAKQATKFYSLIVDIELRTRLSGGGIVKRNTKSNFDSGTSRTDVETPVDAGVTTATDSFTSNETETFSETSEWKRIRSRIIGKAKGKLIAFDDVKGEFTKKLITSISGLF